MPANTVPAERKPTEAEQASYLELYRLMVWAFWQRAKGRSGLLDADKRAAYAYHDQVVNAAMMDGAVFDGAATQAQAEREAS